MALVQGKGNVQIVMEPEPEQVAQGDSSVPDDEDRDEEIDR